MSDTNQRTQELLAQEGLESIGQKLFNNINIELSGDPQSARRWIWELLQNAKDVIEQDGKIEISLTENTVEFAHNGGPFLHSNLLAILSQRSTKAPSYTDDEKQAFFDRLYSETGVEEVDANKFLNTSGRFGTGFMTTYLLSKKISLDSVYTTNNIVKSFKISLDRDAETPDQMKDKVKQSFSSFTELERSDLKGNIIEDFIVGDNCDTKFTYEYDVEGKRTAEIGIADLHQSIPFTLSFVDKIKTIKINEYGKFTIYTKVEPLTFGEITITRIEKETEDNKVLIEIVKVADNHNALTIAIPVEHIHESKYKIIFPDKSTPRQFISFPLVGSETFPFPVIINSPLFNPDDTRSHVFLNLVDSHPFNKKVTLNRSLFEKSLSLFNKLLTFACLKEWENIHYLARSNTPPNVDEIWYKNFIQQPIRREILDAEIVVTENGTKRIKPKDSKFPIYHQEKLDEFWSLCNLLINNEIPKKEDASIWKEIINADTSDWLGADFDFSLEKLLKLIQDQHDLSSFSKKYFESEENAFDALNKIIRFVENENKELVDRKESPLKIFPDQTTDSIFAEKKELSRDMKIPFQIKDVLKTTGDNWYKKLVRDEITVFERENKLTVKNASDKVKEKIEKYFSNKLQEDELQHLKSGLFELIGYNYQNLEFDFQTLHRFAKLIFPGVVSETLKEIDGAEDFDYKPSQLWAIKTVLKKVSEFANLQNLSQHLFNVDYPEVKEQYSEDEKNIMYSVDVFLNDLIQYALGFENNQYHLLSEYAIIPNQLNEFCKYNNEIFNDDKIPQELKKILNDFGMNCGKNLLHTGISIKLYDSRDLKWICSQLDDLVIKEQNNDEVKQPIRELDKWISRQKETMTRMDELFKSFNRKRSGIVLNTYGLEERNQFDEILKSGMSADFADIVKSGTTAETIRELATMSKDINLESALSILKQHPELTSDKIEQLLELEELSKGWNTDVIYNPSEEQIRKNFENGWKGEAFVYKELKKKNFEVEWDNRSETENSNPIIDFEGEKHFIADKGKKYDLMAKSTNGNTIYVQVKATTTDISVADNIALPISTREWKFVLETKEDQSYYLARVFNVNSQAPELYFMKLEKPNEL
jgi:hypothetical protein